MLKRIEKHRKKREEDSKLGIDDEMREELGLDLMDSDDSSSSSEESDASGEQSGEQASSDEGENEWFEEPEDEDMAVENEDAGSASERRAFFPVFTVKKALKEPIYGHPTISKAHLCAICPGKLLVGPLPISQHRESHAHERRAQRLSELAALSENEKRSLSDLLAEIVPPKTEKSKRAEKKRKWAEFNKAKRGKRKEKDRAKKERLKQDEKKAANEKEPTKTSAPIIQDASSSKKKEKDKSKSEPSEPFKDRSKLLKQQQKGVKPATKPEAKKSEGEAGGKRRKQGAEKKEAHRVENQPPPTKKRKVGDDAPLELSPDELAAITEEIKAITKSATTRARDAVKKAKQGGGKPFKSREGKKGKSS